VIPPSQHPAQWPATPTLPLPPMSAVPAPSVSEQARPTRTWYAVLALLLLAPACGEMLSGSTPPLMFINPFSLLVEVGLYGCGALLIRELVKRRGLGWRSVLVLGAAYGILEEGLVVTSWFNPYWPDVLSLHGYSRWLDTNWFWALSLTMYHAVVSISIPIVLAEALFPWVAARPWLRRGGITFLSIWLGLVCVLGVLGFGFLAYRKQGYTHPPLTYFVALALAVILVVLALKLPRPPTANVPPERVPPQPPVAPAQWPRRAPRLWTLRLAGFGYIVAFFAISWGIGPAIRWPPLALVLLATLGALAAWRLLAWSRRAGWGARSRLALAAGAVFFFILLAPLLEFAAHPAGKIMTGMTLAAVFWLAFVVLLAFRLKRFERRFGTTLA
jgi:hypothetical protein